MRQIDPSVAFVIVGDGMEYDTVQTTAVKAGVLDQNVLLKRSITKLEVPDLLRRAALISSCFIDIEALWHNSANKFFDALAAGRPVVINYGGWQKELLERTGAGLAVTPNDAYAAASRISEFLSDEERLEHARQAAHDLGTKEFNRDVLAARLLGILESVHGETAGRAHITNS